MTERHREWTAQPRRSVVRRLRDEEAGYTIVEVMVAIVILVFGVLGTLVLVQGGQASTSRTVAREQGTNLARDLLERSRQAAYADVTVSTAPQTLRATLPASDGATAVTGSPPLSTFQVTRRNVVYTVTVFACSIDDPSDGVGQGNATFCAASPDPPDPVVPPGPAAAVNVLGVSVALGGSLLTTVCNALGNAQVIGRLTALASTVAPVSVCPAGSPVTDANVDGDPDDLRRVRVDVSWYRGAASSVSQTTLLTNPTQA